MNKFIHEYGVTILLIIFFSWPIFFGSRIGRFIRASGEPSGRFLREKYKVHYGESQFKDEYEDIKRRAGTILLDLLKS